MYKPKMIENEKDFQCQNKHDKSIHLVVLDPKLDKKKRLLCTQCMENFESDVKTIGFKKMIQIIEDINEKNTKELKAYFMKLFDSLIRIAQDWNENLLLQSKQNYQYSFYDELDNYINKQNINFTSNSNLINNINKSWMAKLYHNLNQINRDKVDFRELKQKFININYSNISINGEIQLKLINQSVKQSGRCNAIVFDSSGSIMVSTEKNYIIKVWKFQNGKIKLITNLQGHTRHIQCLVYSKKQNSFISGAGDKTIRCWQQVDQFNWISSQAYQQHKDYVRCIILNQNEDLLFSGSTDRSIKVWKINLNKNKLKYLYSLYKHDDIVNALNLNQSETQLVSCAYNKYQIIIWENGEYNKFEFKYIIKQSIQDYGFKVQFIKDNQFIWLTGGQEIDKLFVFELIDGIFQENQDKTIQLLKNNSTIDEYRFPILYNKEMNLIVVRHKTYIYIIRQTNYEKLKIVDFLNCYTDDIYGMITNNAKYLVYWDKKNQAYSTYELLNKQKL